MSGLIVLDFDHLSNINAIREQLTNDSYTYMLFTSPSLDGLKLVIKHNLKNPGKWNFLFNELSAYYKFNYGLNADESGKDISRMCFLPFINDLYQNNDATEYQYTGLNEIEVKKEHTCEARETINDNSDLFKECFYLSAFLIENNINITDTYIDWLSYGYSLCDLGEAGREIFHNISKVSEKYDYDECDYKFDYLLENYDSEKININYYLKYVKYAIANFMIYKKYGYVISN